MISLLLTLALAVDSGSLVEPPLVNTDVIAIPRASQWQGADQLFRQGRVAFDRHDYSQALAHWQRALDLYQALGATIQMAATLNALAATAIAMGEYPDAIAWVQQGLPLVTARSDAMLRAQLLGNLGIAYQPSHSSIGSSLCPAPRGPDCCYCCRQPNHAHHARDGGESFSTPAAAARYRAGSNGRG